MAVYLGNNKVADVGGGETGSVYPFSSRRKLGKCLYEIDYDYIDYDFAEDYFDNINIPVNLGSCSALRDGSYFGRNLDWFSFSDDEDLSPDFIVRTPANLGGFVDHKVVGVAACQSIKEKAIKEDTVSEDLYKILPFYLQDGINDSGLFACINVVPSGDKGVNRQSVPEYFEDKSVCTLMLVRYILDHYDVAEQACSDIQSYVRLWNPQRLLDMGYEVHFMVGDANNTYVLEIVEGHVVYQESDVMTNFFVNGVDFDELQDKQVYTNADVALGKYPTTQGITPFGAGLERHNLLVNADSSLSTQEKMQLVLYGKTYEQTTDPFWYSEYVTTQGGLYVTVDTDPSDYQMQEAIRRATAGEWVTTHSVVYDIENQKLISLLSYEKDYFSFVSEGGGEMPDLTEYAKKTWVTGLGYQTENQVEDIVESYGYQTSSQVLTTVQSQGYQTESEVTYIVQSQGYETSSDVDAHFDYKIQTVFTYNPTNKTLDITVI